MTGFKKLAFVETKLFLREKAATLAVFALPLALVLGFGLIPGFDKPQKGLSDQIGTEYIASIGVAIVLVTLGLNGVPMVIAQYRERGILRRLAVTPVRPLTLLIAKLTVWAAAAVLSATSCTAQPFTSATAARSSGIVHNDSVHTTVSNVASSNSSACSLA